MTKGIKVTYTKYLRKTSWNLLFFPQSQWNFGTTHENIVKKCFFHKFLLVKQSLFLHMYNLYTYTYIYINSYIHILYISIYIYLYIYIYIYMCVCVTYVLYLSIYLFAIYIHGTITLTIIQTGTICKKFLYKSLLNSACFWSTTRHGINKDKSYFLLPDHQANLILIFEFYERTKNA